MSFHIDNLDHNASVKRTSYASVFCVAFVLVGSPFLLPSPTKDESTKTAEVAKSEFSDVGKYMSQYTDDCVNKSQDRIRAWELAGEKNAEQLTLLRCSSEAIDTFVAAHTKIPEFKK
jgi:hypothetical protein